MWICKANDQVNARIARLVTGQMHAFFANAAMKLKHDRKEDLRLIFFWATSVIAVAGRKRHRSAASGRDCFGAIWAEDTSGRSWPVSAHSNGT